MTHQMVLKGIDCRLSAIADLKLGKDIGHMGLDRLERKEEFICNALIVVALGDELKYVSLTRSQLLMKLHMIAMVFDLLADLLLNSKLPSSHLTDSMEQFICTRSLEHIAFGTSIQDRHDFFIVQVRSHNQNLGFRPFFEDG